MHKRSGASAVVSILALLMCGCSGSHTAAQPTTENDGAVGLRFVAASSGLQAKCGATARAVGYPVPCPSRVPEGLIRTPPPRGSIACIDIIGPGGVRGCARSWRHWVVGSSETANQHLVITASPRLLTNYAKLVNGPAWHPKARVRALGWVNVKRWRMRSVYVPPATNDGSAFMSHVVLIWSVGGHTYGIGFHNIEGIHSTLLLDEELAKYVKLVRP